MIDREYARNELELQETDDLLDILVARNEEEWRPEIFPIVEEVLRDRGVSVGDAVEARRRKTRQEDDPERAKSHVEDQPALIAEFDDETAAQMCRMTLLQAGIEAHIDNTDALGEAQTLKLFVSTLQAEAASEVLAAAEEAPTEDDESTGFRCASCGFIAEPIREGGRLVCQVCGEAG